MGTVPGRCKRGGGALTVCLKKSRCWCVYLEASFDGSSTCCKGVGCARANGLPVWQDAT